MAETIDSISTQIVQTINEGLTILVNLYNLFEKGSACVIQGGSPSNFTCTKSGEPSADCVLYRQQSRRVDKYQTFVGVSYQQEVFLITYFNTSGGLNLRAQSTHCVYFALL